MERASKLPDDVARRLRALIHDLSNSLETIVQAAYLLRRAKLGSEEKQWMEAIDTASEQAVRINHQLREILRSQS
jgi:signal transduction histidine kinase